LERDDRPDPARSARRTGNRQAYSRLEGRRPQRAEKTPSSIELKADG